MEVYLVLSHDPVEDEIEIKGIYADSKDAYDASVSVFDDFCEDDEEMEMDKTLEQFLEETGAVDTPVVWVYGDTDWEIGIYKMSITPKKSKGVSFVPGLDHPVTAKIIDEQLIVRNEADFEAYKWILDLFEISDIGFEIETKEFGFWDRWTDIKEKRETANNLFMLAAAGRLPDGQLVNDVHPLPEEDQTDGKD